MGLLLSIFFSYVGAVEFAFIVRDIVHQVGLHQQNVKSNQRSSDDLHQLQQNIRNSLNLARELPCESETVQCMQDGVQYENGYRVSTVDETVNTTERWLEARAKNLITNNDRIEEKLTNTINDLSASDDDFNLGSGHSTNSLRSSSNENSSAKTVLENERWNLVDLNERTNEFETTVLADSSNNENGSPKGAVKSPPNSNDDSVNKIPEMHFDDYSEGYLRALDGVKNKPLARDDGNRRRRANKKLQSSTSASSDEQKRQSRDEELQMFTSLEEEEFELIKSSDYKPLQYSSEPNLKTKKHTRRHNRSPVQDPHSRRNDSEDDEYDYERRQSEAYDEINDPWGDVKPENFHDRDLWRRERALSIPEIDVDSNAEDENGTTSQFTTKAVNSLRKLNDANERSFSPVGVKNTKSSSFEEATSSDHEQAVRRLSKQHDSENVSYEK